MSDSLSALTPPVGSLMPNQIKVEHHHHHHNHNHNHNHHAYSTMAAATAATSSSSMSNVNLAMAVGASSAFPSNKSNSNNNPSTNAISSSSSPFNLSPSLSSSSAPPVSIVNNIPISFVTTPLISSSVDLATASSLSGSPTACARTASIDATSFGGYSKEFSSSSSSTLLNRTTDTEPTSSLHRRKKASRACLHCQKAHLTCDDNRPCQRCIKRGCADTCTDGLRKRAKYLLETTQGDTANTTAATSKVSSTSQTGLVTATSSSSDNNGGPTSSTFDYTDPLSAVAVAAAAAAAAGLGSVTNPNSSEETSPAPGFDFGSETLNLEYAILSSMLANPALAALGNSASGVATPSSTNTNTGDDGRNAATVAAAAYAGLPDMSMIETGAWPNSSTLAQSAAATVDQSLLAGGVAASLDQSALLSSTAAAAAAVLLAQQQQQPSAPTTTLRDVSLAQPLSPSSYSNMAAFGGGGTTSSSNGSKHQSPSLSSSQPLAQLSPSYQSISHGRTNLSASEVYNKVQAPYDYTSGFHHLLQHLKERMSKEDMMRVCRAMASIRPSLIALIMNLTHEDLIFMEKCFQRTLLEFEKLISYSGTPTVVWRRTGLISFVGKEFTLLTQWTRDQLLGKPMYIYELMDTRSAVNYWEEFCMHAFDNAHQSVQTTCTLLSPDGRAVPCTFCFTIKRDIFDVPLAIVGNFLPILR